MTIRSYRDLVVWQKAMDLVVRVYQITAALPKEEQYGITSQMRKASVSIVANLAEGFGRTRKEYAHFVTVARGSQKELETLTEVCLRLGFLTEKRIETCLGLQDEVARMLWALRSKLQRT